MSRVVEHEGVVLKAVDYRDADRILTLYTRDVGRLSAIARGARRSRRRFGGTLQPFCRLRLELTPGRSLWTLKSAQLLTPFSAITTSLSHIDAAAEASALVRDLTVDAAPEPLLFDALLALYENLGRIDTESLLLAFRARALLLAGLAPAIDACIVSGTPRGPGQAAYFDAVRGGVVQRAHLGGAQTAVALSGASLARLEHAMTDGWVPQEPWHDDERRQLRRALTLFCESHVRPPTVG